MNHLDLFSGIGGFALSAKWAGFETIAFCEIEKYCQRVLRKNFGEWIVIHDDIKQLDGTRYAGTIDLLTGGFPCQPFSKSGAQLGMDETRGTLFYNIARILEKRRPKVIVLENVRNLTGPKHKHTWALDRKSTRLNSSH